MPLGAGLLPMEAQAVATLPDGPGWQYEPKWDGFRCLAVREGGEVRLGSRTGKPLARYFPEVVAMLAGMRAERFVLDGELVVPIDGVLSFDALGARLHPAESRVRRLAAETPARFVAFDCLADGEAIADRPLAERRPALERLLAAEPADKPLLSLATTSRADAEAWLARVGDALDGVIAKRLNEPYRPAERAMRKVKMIRTADCVVGGFRWAQNTQEARSRTLGSLLLGLYDADGRLDHVGFTSAFKAGDKAEVLARLEPHRSGPGFTGKAPEGPSRWNRGRDASYEPLAHALVVEVHYDQVSSGRFRHGTTIHRWRPDKAPEQCTREQIKPELAPAALGLALT